MQSSLLTISPQVTTTSTDDAPDLLVVSSAERYYRLSGVARAVLLRLSIEPQDCLSLSSDLALSHGIHDSAVRDAIDQLKRRGIVTEADATTVEQCPPTLDFGQPSRYITFRWKLLNGARVASVSRIFASFVKPQTIATLVPLLLLLQFYFLYRYSASVPVLRRSLDLSSFATLIVLNYLALFLHEMGHAVACSRAGQDPGEIGCGLYLIFPVLYIDVSATWKLPSRGRMLVDIGGIYVSSLLATGSWITYHVSHSPVAGLLGFLITLTVVGNLNPFLRMDGYWLLSDALGVPNLMTLNNDMGRYLLLAAMRRSASQPRIGVATALMRRFYYLYFAGFIGFSLYLVWVMAFSIVPTSLLSIKASWFEVTGFSAGHETALLLFKHLGATAVSILPVVFLLFYVLRPLILGLDSYRQNKKIDGSEPAASKHSHPGHLLSPSK